MRLTRKEQIDKPFRSPTGERVYEMLGAPKHIGGANYHSFSHVVIPAGCSSRLHYHPIAEETYYILSGEGRMLVDDKELKLLPGDALLIHTLEKHQIFNDTDADLEFIAVCAPAWTPDNSVYLDE
ncbi:MAG: cupin domain-containing protein [Oscillospiraceae bacterium]|nr:cupin domain-containing protein [Oscillospiraceae bacterium]